MHNSIIFHTLITSFCPVIFLLPAEKEPRGELWRGQRGGDPGEQALRRWPRRLGSVHTQSLPHRQTHPVLVLCHSASSCPSSGGGVVERLPLHTNPVRQPHKTCPSTSNRKWFITHIFKRINRNYKMRGKTMSENGRLNCLKTDPC